MKSMSCQRRRGTFRLLETRRLASALRPEDAARHLPTDQIDADGMYATAFALLSPIGYNTNLVKPEEAPKSFADLLDPRWKGRIIKANPAYGETILTATLEHARTSAGRFREARRTAESPRCCLRPIRQRSSRWARARYKPTVPSPICCC